jgi:hypothetical protein
MVMSPLYKSSKFRVLGFCRVDFAVKIFGFEWAGATLSVHVKNHRGNLTGSSPFGGSAPSDHPVQFPPR